MKEITAIELVTWNLWKAVEDIGQAWSSSVSKLSDTELAAYGEGVLQVLVLSLERLQVNTERNDDPCLQQCAGKWCNQIRAAVGEQLRRRHPGDRCCQGRKLNEWLGIVRDWRIKLVDDCDLTPFQGPYKTQAHTQLEREMEYWIRHRRTPREPRDPNWKDYNFQHEQAEQTQFYRIKEEASALHTYYCHLVCDDEWREKRAKLEKAKTLTIPVVQQSTGGVL